MSWRPSSLNLDGDTRGDGMTRALVAAQPFARRIGGLVGRRAHAGVDVIYQFCDERDYTISLKR
uniref:Uncharacterized protein n=1 Tax=Oryza barthii TaxID=65489 RepID=A0A0D3H6Q0_9ORYZ